MNSRAFQQLVWDFYEREGRHDMEWRKNITPYRVLVSEVMLQQTQVSRVKDFFARFVRELPDFSALAAAGKPQVLRLWQGLGYNRRALYLHEAAREVVDRFDGVFPQGREDMQSLPGIGPATSGALMAFAFNKPVVFVETNIRRVFLHHFFQDQNNVSDTEVKSKIRKTLPAKNIRKWYWALMDYGSTLPKIAKENPNKRSKHYTKQSKFEGSVRQVRGAILRHLLKAGPTDKSNLQKELDFPADRFKKALSGLCSEGVVEVRSGKVALVE